PVMETIRAHADWSFVGKKPFGVLLLALMLLPLTIVIGIVMAPFVFEGFGFVRSWSLTLFFMALFFNAAHIFGLQRKVIAVGARGIYIPFTLIIFITCLIFMVLYAFASLLSFISVIDSLKFSFRLIVTYIVILLLNLALTFVCARLAILLFRASPNSKVLLLSTVVIEGEKAVRMDTMTSSNGAQFTPAGTPMGVPPV
ncbi:hypothetical protein PFISCL1PPCAC_5975, partial [Pristionchus fissidentatus]